MLISGNEFLSHSYLTADEVITISELNKINTQWKVYWQAAVCSIDLNIGEEPAHDVVYFEHCVAICRF